MNIILLSKTIENPVFAVPEFNFGQMQRWKGHRVLRYAIEIEKSVFINKTESFFSEFRINEIEEDDDFDLPELISFRKAGRPTLNELFLNNLNLLKELIIYHEYEVLHLLISSSFVGNFFYSINSIDVVEFNKNKIQLEGVCFEVDRK